jgi:putative ABC transport system permease protein
MMLFKVASRSIFRNTRRSLTTMLTIAVGTAATLVFGAYTTYVTYGLQTATVQRVGHLAIYRNGYFDFGSGNPAIWGISHYDRLLRLVADDPVLKPMIAVATPVQSLAGIAGNFDKDESRTFLGTGFLPSDRDAMKRWNEYGVGSLGVQHSGLSDSDSSQGIVGIGLARILGLCDQLHLDKCPKVPDGAPATVEVSSSVSSLPRQDFSDLVARDKPAAADPPGEGRPHIDLLAATAGGAPNVVSLEIRRVEPQGVRELDDAFVGMHLALAQQLVYGRGEHRATGVVLQLHRTQDLEKARARLKQVFADHRLDLEVRDFAELNPFYTQAINLFGSIFSFISVIIAVVVLFTVSNAMGMSVVERTDEIGTTRALGVRRSGIRRQFLLEGAMLGLLGATLGVVIALVVAYFVNGAGITYTPPAQAQPVPLRLYMLGAPGFVAIVWVILTVVATLAAYLPANRAAKLQIVDALRHV